MEEYRNEYVYIKKKYNNNKDNNHTDPLLGNVNLCTLLTTFLSK